MAKKKVPRNFRMMYLSMILILKFNLYMIINPIRTSANVAFRFLKDDFNRCGCQSQLRISLFSGATFHKVQFR